MKYVIGLILFFIVLALLVKKPQTKASTTGAKSNAVDLAPVSSGDYLTAHAGLGPKVTTTAAFNGAVVGTESYSQTNTNYVNNHG